MDDETNWFPPKGCSLVRIKSLSVHSLRPIWIHSQVPIIVQLKPHMMRTFRPRILVIFGGYLEKFSRNVEDFVFRISIEGF